MDDNSPAAMRKVYFEAWQKELKSLTLSPMEAIIVDIIKRHPEYQPIFSHQEAFENFQAEKYAIDGNPFFHLALHVTICEQVGADRPQGIRALYQKLLKKHHDQTVTEHKMMECLARVLVDSFQHDTASNEQKYLEMIKRLL
jgi:hypothetical protein